MPSIIPGYAYDIFISYRQKDNKGDKWVSTFVEALKTELEATFKEDVSVYFDENPHDGLQETHNVDKSLEGKLKCLVFIPVLSQTYCDPNSYAWQYEFLAFLQAVKNDRFDKDIKLRGGNVASRILPIRIHDLEPEDVKMFEKETGSVLRSLDFIFKTASGVSRPLKVNEDHPQDNINKTYYSDQINKVGHAIKEIIQGMKAESAAAGEKEIQHRELLKETRGEERIEVHVEKGKVGKGKLITLLSVTAILIIGMFILYPKIFKRDTLERLRTSGEKISIAVMPFQNMTNDTIWDLWQDGIKDELINYMTNSEVLKVRQTESINYLIHSEGLSNYTSITPSVASAISRKLEADVYINGSIKQAGNKIRLNAQIIESRTKEPLKSFQIEGLSSEENIFQVIDSLSAMIMDYFFISELKNETGFLMSKLISTNNPEAYRYFVQGAKTFDQGNFSIAIDMFLKSIAIDSSFFLPNIYISVTYEYLGLLDQAKKCCLDIYLKSGTLPLWQKYYSSWLYARLFGTPNEELVILKQLLDIDNQLPFVYYEIGNGYNDLYEYEKAIPEYEKALEIYKKWDIKPRWCYNYTELGIAYHKTGQYKKEKLLYKEAEKDFPDNESIVRRQAILELTAKKTKAANEFIDKYISLDRERLIPEPDIITNLAGIYSEANIPDKAEEYFRQALSLEPENPDRMNNLGYFLINKDRNINEGMDYVYKALGLIPDNYSYLDAKGWGLYKQGKYKESLETLQKSWDLRREKAVYDHEAFLHLETAKKAAGK